MPNDDYTPDLKTEWEHEFARIGLTPTQRQVVMFAMTVHTCRHLTALRDHLLMDSRATKLLNRQLNAAKAEYTRSIS